MLSNWWYPPDEGNRSSTDDGRVDTDDDTQVMEPDQGNGESPVFACFFACSSDKAHLVLSHLVSQLRPGADLSRIVLPTFILEPRSMLERITKSVVPYQYACHKI